MSNPDSANFKAHPAVQTRRKMRRIQSVQPKSSLIMITSTNSHTIMNCLNPKPKTPIPYSHSVFSMKRPVPTILIENRTMSSQSILGQHCRIQLMIELTVSIFNSIFYLWFINRFCYHPVAV